MSANSNVGPMKGKRKGFAIKADSVTGSQENPKLAGGVISAAGGAIGAASKSQDLAKKNRMRELRKQLKQLKAWLDTDCMTRSQHKFARISIDEEMRAAKRN